LRKNNITETKKNITKEIEEKITGIEENITEEVPEEISEKPEEEEEIEITIKLRQFTDICEETCDLRSLNLNKSSYKLKIEISNAELKLDEVKYEIMPVEVPEAPVPENITPEINITPINITEVNFTETTLQYRAVIGKPVKWKKFICLKEPGIAKVKLPKEAENITIKKIKEAKEKKPPKPYKAKKEIKKIPEEITENITEEQEVAEENITEEVPEEKSYSEEQEEAPQQEESPSQSYSEEQEEAPQQEESPSQEEPLSSEEVEEELTEEETIEEKEPAKATITGQVGLEIELGRKFGLVNFLKNIFSRLTGQAIVTEKIEEAIEVTIEDTALEYEIEYETPAPQAFEENISKTRKRIIISAPSKLNYTDILAYTQLPEILKTEQEKAIQIHWLENESYVEFTALDTDNNSLIDYIEWVVPYLSNQTYEISIIILNVKSYPTIKGNWTVRFNTTGQANLTITAINYTTWTNYSENSSLYDLKFLEIRCGNQTLNYEWLGSSCENSRNCSIFIQDYQCNETGYETSKVITYGHHYLEFIFGENYAYAENYVGCTGTEITYCSDIQSDGEGNCETYYSNNEGGPTGYFQCATAGPPGSNCAAGDPCEAAAPGDTTAPNVSLIAPPNNTYKNTQTVWFQANFTDNIQLKNSTLYIWNSSNVNINKTTREKKGTSNSSNISVTLSYDGYFTWNYYVCDNASTPNCAWNNTNYTLRVDSISPDINFTQPPTPPNDTSTTNTSIEINISITEANLREVKFNWNKTNYTVYNDSLVLMFNFDKLTTLFTMTV